MRRLITNYLRYEWGPVYMAELFSLLSGSNYLKILNSLLTGERELFSLTYYIRWRMLHVMQPDANAASMQCSGMLYGVKQHECDISDTNVTPRK